jgi:carbon monoxide dehydrogenase subunit G
MGQVPASGRSQRQESEQMELEHSFTVPVPENRAWEVLLDVERVAPCMPGATLDSVDGDEIKGRIRVKVGPISMTYAGTARFTERDPSAHVITLEASGKETRGAGTASATVRSMLEGQGDATHVVVHTTLNITGKPAQFGRGVLAEVGGKLIGIFAANLAEMLAGNPSAAAAGNGAAAPARTTGANGKQDGSAGATDSTSASSTSASSTGASSTGSRSTGSDAAANGATAGGASQAAGSGTAPAVAGQDQPLEELALPLRAYNALRRDGVHTVNELAARSPAELLAIEGIGPASVEDIRRRLADLGLPLGEQPSGQDAGSSPAGTVPVGSVPFGAGAADRGAADPGAADPGAADLGASPASPAADAWAGQPDDDDAIDLLSVAGLPVLKRLVPVLAGLAALALVLIGARSRRRRR